MRIVIIANGEINHPSNILEKLQEGDHLVAVDGGTNHYLSAGLWPHVVIGDMDSISHSILQDLIDHGSEFIEYPTDKDQTDLNLALDYAVNLGADEVLLLGFLGGRLDQSLANILLLARDEWKELGLILSDGPDTAFLMRSHDARSIHGQPGDIVSLIPLSEIVTDVNTIGLKWSLSNSELAFGSTLSVSNQLLGASAEVQIGSGKILLIHRQSLPD